MTRTQVSSPNGPVRRPQVASGRVACVDYAAIVSIASYETMGWLRAAVGVALIAAPGVPMRLAGQEAPSGADMLLMRTIGIRDLVLGLCTVAAARSDDLMDVPRWTHSPPPYYTLHV